MLVIFDGSNLICDVFFADVTLIGVDTLKWEYIVSRKEQPSIEKCNHTQQPNKGHDWLNSIR